MAGTDPRFPAQRFRDAIRFAMHMGLPNAVQERITFRWTTQKTFSTHDPAGRPYNWGSTPATTTSHADVLIDCAVEFTARPAGTRDTALGEFDTSRAVVTILDEDIDSVSGADTAIIGGNEYEILFTAPPMGLFEVTVYQLYLQARDES